MTIDTYISELRELRNNERYSCCVVVAEEILREYPENSIVHRILASCYSALERYDDAFQSCNLAIELSTEKQRYISIATLAFTYHQQGNHNQAIEIFCNLFKEYPPRPIDAVCCAESLVKVGRYLEAIDLLIDSEKNNKNHRPIHFYVLGVAYRSAEKYSEASECFRQCLLLQREEDEDYEAAEVALEDIVEMNRMKISLVK